MLIHRRALITAILLLVCCAPAFAKEPAIILHGEARAGIAKTDAEIEAALDQLISIDLTGESIKEFLNELGKKLGVAVAYDEKSLVTKHLEFLKMPDEDKTDSRVLTKLDRVRARVAMKFVLEREGISWIVESGRILVMAAEEVEDTPKERTYDVSDLIDLKAPEASWKFLKRLLRHELGKEAKFGPATFTAGTDEEDHQRIEEVLKVVRRAKTKFATPRAKTPAIEIMYSEDFSPEEIAMREALAKPGDWDFKEQPLEEVAKSIAKRLKINIQFNTLALSEAGIPVATPISFRAKQISASAFWHHVLASHNLAYVTRENVLIITTTESASGQYAENVAFPVYDLLPDLAGKPETEEYKDAWFAIEELTKSLIMEDSWREFHADGSIFRDMHDGIFYAQLEPDHADTVLRTLQTLRRAKIEAETKMERRPVMFGSRRDQEIYGALAAPAPMIAPKSDSLADATEALSEKLGIPVLLDYLALMDVGIDWKKTLKLAPKAGRSLDDALAVALKPLGLEAIVDREALVITAEEYAGSYSRVRFLPVEPLLNPRVPRLKSSAALDAFIQEELIGKGDARKLDFPSHCSVIKLGGKWVFLASQLKRKDQSRLDRLIREAAKP